MTLAPSIPASHRIYDLYGKFYDLSESFFRQRLARALARVPFRPGDHALDVGIGTGISLPFYPLDVHLTGIDLSLGMLRKAQSKLDSGTLRPHALTRLLRADALHLPFPDHSFDVVFLSHVLATVPDSHRCLHEALRVTRHFGQVVIVNHFQSTNPFLRTLERLIDPLCRRLGWRNDLHLPSLLQPLAITPPRLPGLSPFTTLYLQKLPQSTRLLHPTPN